MYRTCGTLSHPARMQAPLAWLMSLEARARWTITWRARREQEDVGVPGQSTSTRWTRWRGRTSSLTRVGQTLQVLRFGTDASSPEDGKLGVLFDHLGHGSTKIGAIRFFGGSYCGGRVEELLYQALVTSDILVGEGWAHGRAGRNVGIPRMERTTAPMIIRMVWMKSVQMTAVRPPAMVKRQAMPSSIRMEK